MKKARFLIIPGKLPQVVRRGRDWASHRSKHWPKSSDQPEYLVYNEEYFCIKLSASDRDKNGWLKHFRQTIKFMMSASARLS